MRFQCRIGNGVVPMMVPMAACRTEASPAPCAIAATRPRGQGGLVARGAIAAAILAVAGGCATPDAGTRPWKVEPVFHVTHSSQSSNAYYALGQYYEGSMAWDQAIAAYRNAVAADPTNVEAHDALGVALAQTGRLAQAESVLREAVALAPDRPRLRNNLGYVLLLAGKTDEAVAVLQSVVEQDGRNAIARANLNDALARSGRAAPAAPVAVAAAAPSTTVAAAAAAQPPVVTQLPTVTQLPVATQLPAPPHEEPAALASPAPQTPAAARVEVSNGNGIAGMAARVGRWLAAHGAPVDRLSNRQPYTQRRTVVQYRAGQEGAAQQVARLLPADALTEPQPTTGLRTDVRVVLGRDWVQAAACLQRETCRSSSTTVALAAVHD